MRDPDGKEGGKSGMGGRRGVTSVTTTLRPTPVSVLVHMVTPLARLRTLDLRAMPLQPLFRLHSLRASCIFSLT